MHILRCMGSKFCVKFQRAPLKFHSKFWTHTSQNKHFTVCNFCVWVTIYLNCGVISLSEMGPRISDYKIRRCHGRHVFLLGISISWKGLHTQTGPLDISLLLWEAQSLESLYSYRSFGVYFLEHSNRELSWCQLYRRWWHRGIRYDNLQHDFYLVTSHVIEPGSFAVTADPSVAIDFNYFNRHQYIHTL